MGKTIIIDYDGCIIPNSQPCRVNASPFYAWKLAEMTSLNRTDFVFCSERGIEMLEKSAEDFERYGIRITSIIGECGSIVKDRKNGRMEMLVPKEQVDFVKRLKEFFKELAEANHYQVQDNKKTVVTMLMDSDAYTNDQFFQKCKDLTADLISYGLIKETDIEKVRLVQTFQGVDIYPSASSKDKAVRRLLIQAGLDDTFIGIGDSYNDLKWLKLIKEEFGGVIIVPTNAVDDVKIIADYVGNGESIEGVVNGLSMCLGQRRIHQKTEEEIFVY